jgi:hypothetical protein
VGGGAEEAECEWDVEDDFVEDEFVEDEFVEEEGTSPYGENLSGFDGT